jgi:hypothetical protein
MLRELKWNNGNHHRVAARKVSKVERSRSATSVHGFVIGLRDAPGTGQALYHIPRLRKHMARDRETNPLVSPHQSVYGCNPIQIYSI